MFCLYPSAIPISNVANVLVGTSGKQLNDLLKEEPFKSAIHPIIRQAIEKVYAYRGAAPGVSHGQVGSATVGLAEATWVLAVSAATILYLVEMFAKAAT